MPTRPKTSRPAWLPERKPHTGRTKPNQALYNSKRWRKLAATHKQANPLCVQCYAKGIVEPVYVTDHIVPINKGGGIWDWDNLQSLCRRCHDAKSAAEAHDKAGGSEPL